MRRQRVIRNRLEFSNRKQPYTCEMPLDFQQCMKNNIHNRTAADIQKAIDEWIDAPPHYIQLDYRSLTDATDTAASESQMELDAISDDDQVTIRVPSTPKLNISIIFSVVFFHFFSMH